MISDRAWAHALWEPRFCDHGLPITDAEGWPVDCSDCDAELASPAPFIEECEESDDMHYEEGAWQ